MFRGLIWVTCISLTMSSAGLAAAPGKAHSNHWDWIKSSPAAEQLDEAALASLVKDIRAGAYSDIHSLLVIRNDRLVLEGYFAGVAETLKIGPITWELEQEIAKRYGQEFLDNLKHWGQ